MSLVLKVIAAHTLGFTMPTLLLVTNVHRLAKLLGLADALERLVPAVRPQE